MITLFCATNRPDSASSKIAQYAFRHFQNKGADVHYFSLEDLPPNLLHSGMYEEATQSPELAAIQDKYVIPADKFYFVIPEYNGSYPGILKLFWDAVSIRQYKQSFHGGKKAALLGVADGRAGNLRGLDHFTGVLNYLQINVMPNRQPISAVSKILNERGDVSDEATRSIIERHVSDFIAF